MRVKSTDATEDSLIDAVMPRASSTSLSRSSESVSTRSASQALADVKLCSDTLLSTSKVTLQVTESSNRRSASFASSFLRFVLVDITKFFTRLTSTPSFAAIVAFSLSSCDLLVGSSVVSIESDSDTVAVSTRVGAGVTLGSNVG